jgi:hypothetical protein
MERDSYSSLSGEPWLPSSGQTSYRCILWPGELDEAPPAAWAGAASIITAATTNNSLLVSIAISLNFFLTQNATVIELFRCGRYLLKSSAAALVRVVHVEDKASATRSRSRSTRSGWLIRSGCLPGRGEDQGSVEVRDSATALRKNRTPTRPPMHHAITRNPVARPLSQNAQGAVRFRAEPFRTARFFVRGAWINYPPRALRLHVGRPSSCC